MSEIKNTAKNLVDLLRKLDKEGLVERLQSIAEDMEMLLGGNYLWLKFEYDYPAKLRILGWQSKVEIGTLTSECLTKKTFYQCLDEEFDYNKTKMLEKLLSAFVEELNKLLQEEEEEEDP